MLNNDFIANLLEIEDLILIDSKVFSGVREIEFKLKQKPCQCPACSSITSKVHDYRTQFVKDAPMLGLRTRWKLHKRRYVCKNCGKRFYEHVPMLPKFQRTTTRIWGCVLNDLSKPRSMKDIGSDYNISGTSVSRIMSNLSYAPASLPETISIDEFRGNSGGQKFNCILTNPKTKKILDILPSRKSEDLAEYFSRFTNRKNVKYVVMDLSTLFRSVAENCFPNAEIVADKFHVMRLVTWAMDDIRKSEQKKFAATRRKYFKRSKSLLMRSKSDLKEDELEQLSHMLEISKPLAQAYYLYQEFRGVMSSKDEYEAKRRLASWFMAVGVTDPVQFKRFHTCVDTFIEWEKEILNSFRTGLSNGYTEGCNNRIKVIKRIAYGMRNFENFRNRILHQMAN